MGRKAENNSSGKQLLNIDIQMLEAVAAYDSMEADPSRGVPANIVFERMRILYAKRMECEFNSPF